MGRQVAISEINQWGRWQPTSNPASKQQVVELEPGFLSVEKSTRLDTFPTTFFLASLIQAKVGSQVASANLVARKGNQIYNYGESRHGTRDPKPFLTNNEANRSTAASQQTRLTTGR